MIIFNTLKSAQHYVKWCNHNKDFTKGYHNWETFETYIDENLVKTKHFGDSCGCGCDLFNFSTITVIGRIKKWNKKATRELKIRQIIRQ